MADSPAKLTFLRQEKSTLERTIAAFAGKTEGREEAIAAYKKRIGEIDKILAKSLNSQPSTPNP